MHFSGGHTILSRHVAECDVFSRRESEVSVPVGEKEATDSMSGSSKTNPNIFFSGTTQSKTVILHFKGKARSNREQ